MPLAVVPPNVGCTTWVVALNLSVCTRRRVLAREHYKNNISIYFIIVNTSTFVCMALHNIQVCIDYTKSLKIRKRTNANFEDAGGGKRAKVNNRSSTWRFKIVAWVRSGLPKVRLSFRRIILFMRLKYIIGTSWSCALRCQFKILNLYE